MSFKYNNKPPIGAVLNPLYPLNRGLQAWYLFNEFNNNTVWYYNDSSLYRRHGDDNGFLSTQFGVDVPSGAYLYLPTGNCLDGKSAFSLCTICSVDDITADRPIFGTYQFNGAHPLLFWFDNAAKDNISLRINTSTGGSGSQQSNAAAAPNTWYRIIATWDGATVRLYIDGVEDTGLGFPFSIGGTLNTSPERYKIGRVPNFNFDGQFETFAIYDRALSPAEVVEWSFNTYGDISHPRFMYQLELSLITSGIYEFIPPAASSFTGAIILGEGSVVSVPAASGSASLIF